MISFPNSKINLGLHITGKRPDGYHDLETIFYPISLRDCLEVIGSNETTFTASGLQVNADVKDNICLKAYHLLKQDFPDLPAVNIHLHKVIPIGAGLGGGSADGTFMLVLLNSNFDLQLNEKQLINYALRLGSDCPFFIINQPVFATGRGEAMVSLPIDLSPYKIVLVNPGIHISTREAFSKITPALTVKSLKDIVQQPIQSWKDELVNDFEKHLFKLYPSMKKIKGDLYDAGAVYACTTGSGSTVFGIFEKDAMINISFPGHYLQIHLPVQ